MFTEIRRYLGWLLVALGMVALLMGAFNESLRFFIMQEFPSIGDYMFGGLAGGDLGLLMPVPMFAVGFALLLLGGLIIYISREA